MRAAPHKPVKIVPLSQRTDTRLRSKSLLTPPSRDSGGSLPRSIAPDCALCQSRALPWSNFVRPLPPCSPRTNRRPIQPSFPRNLRVPIDARGTFTASPATRAFICINRICVDLETKPETTHPAFPLPQDAARLWLECDGGGLRRSRLSDCGGELNPIRSHARPVEGGLSRTPVTF